MVEIPHSTTQVKLFGWEKKMQKRVADKRDDELVATRWSVITHALYCHHAEAYVKASNLGYDFGSSQ